MLCKDVTHASRKGAPATLRQVLPEGRLCPPCLANEPTQAESLVLVLISAPERIGLVKLNLGGVQHIECLPTGEAFTQAGFHPDSCTGPCKPRFASRPCLCFSIGQVGFPEELPQLRRSHTVASGTNLCQLNCGALVEK